MQKLDWRTAPAYLHSLYTSGDSMISLLTRDTVSCIELYLHTSVEKTVYTNGTSLTVFYDGKRNGTFEMCDVRGRPIRQDQYVNGEMDGMSRYWYGVTLTEQYTYQKGIMDGECYTYHYNGDVKSKYVYKNGFLISVQRWNLDGTDRDHP